MKTIELWPSPVLGPVVMAKLGLGPPASRHEARAGEHYAPLRCMPDAPAGRPVSFRDGPMLPTFMIPGGVRSCGSQGPASHAMLDRL
jgi:hypothetical protein